MMPDEKDTRRGRKRPDRFSITLDARQVERYTRLAAAIGMNRYELMNAIIRGAADSIYSDSNAAITRAVDAVRRLRKSTEADDRTAITTAPPRLEGGSITVAVVGKEPVLVEWEPGATQNEISQKIAAAIAERKTA